VLIRPHGCIHSKTFREVAETLQFGLHSIGHAAQIGENTIDATIGCEAPGVGLQFAQYREVESHELPPRSDPRASGYVLS
jgi:hypothetical protein